MSFNLQDNQSDDAIMSEINMTPMVDVMLVLLIIFIITLPVIQQAVKVELPKANSVRNEVKPESVQLSIDAQGQIFWNSNSVRNEVKPESVQLSIDAQGQIFWNSTPIDLKTFDGYAEKAAQKEPQPQTRVCATEH
ncbi:MAG: biopolymer transporter ExbD [Polynucleobacter sp. 39-45-136]|nr:MAG: biopolymer transporter ExbD [Polynucleobacter sp. 39-45-136]